MHILITVIKILIATFTLILIPAYIIPNTNYYFIILFIMAAVLFIVAFPFLMSTFLALAIILFFPEVRAWAGAEFFYAAYRPWLFAAFLYVTAVIAFKVIRAIYFKALQAATKRGRNKAA